MMIRQFSRDSEDDWQNTKKSLSLTRFFFFFWLQFVIWVSLVLELLKRVSNLPSLGVYQVRWFLAC